MPEKREDVEATPQQDTAPDTSQQKRKWRAIDWIAGTTFATEVLMSFIWAILWVHECRFEHQLQVYLALVLIILTGGYFALIFCPIFKEDDDPRWFHARILSSGIVGGSYAFLLPAVMGLEEGSINSGGAAALRQAILLATGGLIGLIALGETRRKNDNDREAAEKLWVHQQNTLGQQKEHFEKQLEKQQEQFETNAFKERKAERRERYTNAVEQLGDEKAPIRMGGVYTLVGLVDEWLEEESLEKYEDRLKEGQVIINNLCAYIRSPFTLATRYDELDKDSPTPDGVYKDNQQEFYTDKAEFKAEKDVRLGIIKEIHDRLQGLKENTPGKWSDFEYNFSGSIFFYPVDLSYSHYNKPINFSGSTYNDKVLFNDSVYNNKVYFTASIYRDKATFNCAFYKKGAIFSTPNSPSNYKGSVDFSGSTYGGSTYEGSVTFSGATYEKKVTFSTVDSPSTYKDNVYFNNSVYKDMAYFTQSTYNKKVTFSTVGFPSTYKKLVNFSGSTYKKSVIFSGATYEKKVTFSTPDAPSTYKGSADFSGSTYEGLVIFSGATYKKKVTFSTPDAPSTYIKKVDFYGSIYNNLVNFSNSIYKDIAFFNSSIYKGQAHFTQSIYENEAIFSSHNSLSTYEGKVYFKNSIHKGRVCFANSIYEREVDFSNSIYKGKTNFISSIYKGNAIFTGSIFYSVIKFNSSTLDNSLSARFTNYCPQFYNEANHKNTLFGSHNNDFTVDTDSGYPIGLNIEVLPIGCKFLTSAQKKHLADKFQEIGKTKNKLREVKDPKEKAELSKNLQALNEGLHEWREEATTVKVEDLTAEDTES
ncbi:hypothetical protein [Rothia aeria]|uniref:hypothetical protein n=1 Tax=Rothia aeria TaxID=172042 RepID=UPI00288BACD5|nr:hypothetical protein [Rothia aeria]